MVRASTTREAIYADLEALPEHAVGEIIDGELIVSPRPAMPRAHAASILGALLIPKFQLGLDGPGGWRIYDEPELHLGHDVLVPDLAGWRKERLPTLPKGVWAGVTPDWVCEVLSPSTARLDRTRKLAIYAREDIQHVWLIDPLAKIVEAYARSGDLYVLLKVISEESLGLPPFDAVELPFKLLWDEAPADDEAPAAD